MRGERHLTALAIVSVLGLSVVAQPQQSSSNSRPPKARAQPSIESIVLPKYALRPLAGPHLDTYEKNCLICHSTRYVTMQPLFPRATWEKEVKKMIEAYGATISEADQRQIIDYLVAVRGATEAKGRTVGPENGPRN